jgi:hypothetical protein
VTGLDDGTQVVGGAGEIAAADPAVVRDHGGEAIRTDAGLMQTVLQPNPTTPGG